MPVIKMPPRMDCLTCGVQLRPATRAEINIALASPDRQHVAEAVAQGRLDAETPKDWPGWMGSPAGSWLLVCDRCGLHLRHQPALE